MVKDNLLFQDIKVGTKVYYARIMPTCGIFEVGDLKVRNVKDNWFSAVDQHTKQAYLFFEKQLNTDIFFNRKEALDKVLAAEDKYRQENKERNNDELFD